MAWDDAKIERLKGLYQQGLSATQIANYFGDGTTRNAVIGKIVRLGLNQGASARRTLPRPSVSKPVRIPKPERRPPEPEPRPVVPPPAPVAKPAGQPITFLELTPYTCRWPLGGVEDPVTHFCGAPVAVPFADPYCPEHMEARVSKTGMAGVFTGWRRKIR